MPTDAFARGGPISLERLRADIEQFRREHDHMPKTIELSEAEYEALKAHPSVRYFAGNAKATSFFGIPLVVKKDG